MHSLYDHLGDAGASKGLATNEGLSLDPGSKVTEGREGKDYGGGDQTGSGNGNAEPLNQSHDTVSACAHVIRRDPADRGIEARRGRANSQ